MSLRPRVFARAERERVSKRTFRTQPPAPLGGRVRYVRIANVSNPTFDKAGGSGQWRPLSPAVRTRGSGRGVRYQAPRQRAHSVAPAPPARATKARWARPTLAPQCPTRSILDPPP